MTRLTSRITLFALTLLLLPGVRSLQAGTIPDDGWWWGLGNDGYAWVDRIGFYEGNVVATGSLSQDSRIVSSPAMWNGVTWETMRGAGLPNLVDFVTWRGHLVGRGVFRGASGVNVAIWNGTDWQVLPRPAAGEPTSIQSDGDLLIVVNTSSDVQTIHSWDGAGWQLIGSDLGPIDRIAVWAGAPVVKRVRTISAATGTTRTSDILVLRDGTWQTLYEGTPGVWIDQVVSSGPDLYNTTVRFENGSRFTRLHHLEGGQWIDEGSEIQGSLAHLVVTGSRIYAIDGAESYDARESTPGTLYIFENGDWRASPDLIYGRVQDAAGIDGDIYVAGWFDFAGDQIVHGLARFDGSSWQPVVRQSGGGADERVRAILPYGGRLVVAGSFSILDNQIRSGIALGDGQTWEALGGGVNDAVFGLAELDGDLIAGGDFDQAGDVSARRVARWNGNAWQPMGDGFDDRVTALVTWSGELYAAGWFQNSGPRSCRHIARWDGQTWQPVGDGVDGPVLAMAVYDNQLFVGGDFRHAGSVSSPFLAKFDGVTWTPGDGLSGAVLSMTVWGEHLVVGGVPNLFENNGVLNSVALWNGASWSTIDGADCGWVTALGSYRGSLVTGGFCGPEYAQSPSIAFWNGSDWSSPQTGLDGPVLSLGQLGSDLFIGGQFDKAGGNPSRNLARWNETLVSAAPAGFTSSRVGSRVELSWTAAEPANSRGFEVYRVIPESGSQLLGMARVGDNRRLSFTDSLPPSGAGSYLLRELGPYGTEQWHGPFSISSLHPGLTVSAPSPNPFRETTRLEFTLSAPGRITLEIHDVQGRLVRALENAWMPAGVFETSWDGRDDGGHRLSTGIYWVLARADGQTVSRKILLFR